MSEMRYDPITGEWVVVATVRARRPDSFAAAKTASKKAPRACPFCVGEEHQTPPEVLAYRNGSQPNGPGWQVRAFENKFPAFALNGSPTLCVGDQCRRLVGSGRHEVLVLSPDHRRHLAMLNDDEVRLVVQAYMDRYRWMETNRNLKYVSIITNQGQAAGSTLEHPHSQIFAVPMVPKAVKRETQKMVRHYQRTGRCLVCDIMKRERRTAERMVTQNELFTCHIPYASAYPFEMVITPKQHQADFAAMDDKHVEAFAAILRECSKMMQESLGDPAYNSFLHTPPLHEDVPKGAVHWDWHIRPRLTTLGGFEHATGLVINPTRPEDSAEFLRNHLQMSGEEHL